MDLELEFAGGNVTGDGIDDVGIFLIKGRYDAANRECHWTKTYSGRHDVFYRGFREGKGIWGTWEIGERFHGGFHIWPKGVSEVEEDVASAEVTAPADQRGYIHEFVGDFSSGCVLTPPAEICGRGAGGTSDVPPRVAPRG
jgi:hypothetical protein